MNQLKNFKKDLVRLLVVCLAAVLMALTSNPLSAPADCIPAVPPA